MSNQNRFLLPHQPSTSSTTSASGSHKAGDSSCSAAALAASGQENEFQVDTDFDSYWEEEARNPHRNRIRIGRQYQATVPALLKQGERDQRKLEDLETLSFCTKRSAKVTDAELDHYFTVAKSLNLFASLVETRSLLGRDVTIADLNRIRQKEGLSLASVIQPSRQTSTATTAAPQLTNIASISPHSSQPTSSSSSIGNQQSSPSEKSPTSASDGNGSRPTCLGASMTSPKEPSSQDNVSMNQPLMKALSHFISLHHPCHHDDSCKKMLKDIPLDEESSPVVSITAGNLRGSPTKEIKQFPSRSRIKKSDEVDMGSGKDLVGSDTSSIQTQQQLMNRSSYDDWTREEVELFSKAIEVCGKNFSSIKKEFLPSKSVRSIVEYYYIGSRDSSEGKKKPTQNVETSESCSGAEKLPANNNNNGQGGGGSSEGVHQAGKDGPQNNATNLSTHSSSSTGRNSASSTSSNNTHNGKSIADGNERYNNTQSTNNSSSKCHGNSKQPKNDLSTCTSKPKSKSIDARMSVYNFDDEIRDDVSPVRFECPRPGAEVKPLKAKPIIPNSPVDGDASNSNVGSLKFFMDGQLVLKLNACQEQQEGNEKCHWVQSGDKLPPPAKQKRYNKRASDRSISEYGHNGSQSNSVVSSSHDDDSKTGDLMSGDEDSKESAISFSSNAVTPRPKSFSASPTLKRARSKNEPSLSPNQALLQTPSLSQYQSQQLSSPIDYNRLAVSNRMKERSESTSLCNITAPPLVNQAASMPWLQANSFAVAAALLGGLPFPTAASSLVNNQIQNSAPTMVNMATKPMDLSVEHTPPKPIQGPKPSRSRSKQRN